MRVRIIAEGFLLLNMGRIFYNIGKWKKGGFLSWVKKRREKKKQKSL